MSVPIPRAGVTHDAVLDGQGLLLVPNATRVFDTNSFAPQVRSDNPRYQDFSAQQWWVMDSWHHGRGSFEWRDPASFYDASGCWTHIPGQATIAGAQNLTTKSGGVSLGGAPLLFRLLTTSASLYCGTGGASRDLFAWDNSNTYWVAETSGITADPTALTEFKGDIWLAQGESANARKKSGGSWGDGGAPAVFLLNFEDQVLYRTDNINEVYFTTDGSTWNGPLYVGDTNTYIRGIAVGDGKLWIGKDDGLYYLQEQRVYQALDLQWARDSNNFKAMLWWQGALWFSLLTGLWRLTGSTLQSVGPDLGAGWASDPGSALPDAMTMKGLISGHRGKIVDLAGAENFLYACVDGGLDLLSASSNKSQIMVWNGQGWHQFELGAAANNRMRSCFVTGQLAATGTFSRPRVWWGYASDAYNVITPFGTEDPYDYSGQTYQVKTAADAATITTPWFDAGLANVYKSWSAIHVYSDGLVNSENGGFVKFYIELDGYGAFSAINLTLALDTAYVSPYQRLPLVPGIVSKKIRIRMDLYNSLGSGAGTSTPRIKAVVAGYHVRPETAYARQVTVRAGRRMSNPYTGEVEDYDPDEMFSFLKSARNRKIPLYWEDPSMEPGIINYILNPAFDGGSALSASTAGYWDKTESAAGTYGVIQGLSPFHHTCQKVTSTGSSQSGVIAVNNLSVTPGQPYVFSIHIAQANLTNMQIIIDAGGISGISSAGVIASKTVDIEPQGIRLDALGGQTDFNAVFQRHELVFTPTSSTLKVRVRAASGSSGTFYLAAAQLEEAAGRRMHYRNKATAYCDGNQPGCYWQQGAHNVGPSFRPGAQKVFITNIQAAEVKRPAVRESVRGHGAERRITMTLLDANQ